MRTFTALLLAIAAGNALAQPTASKLQRFEFSSKDMAPAACALPDLSRGDFKVLAAGEYGGQRSGIQIDQSGHEATRIDVAVNSTDKPVVLILGAYEPTIWNIGWSSGTQIVGVYVSGYHRQAVMGLPRGTPMLNSSYDNRGPCGYFYVESDSPDALKPFAMRVFGRPVDRVYTSRKGKVVMGDMIDERIRLVTSADFSLASLREASTPLAGEAGLRKAVRDGVLRLATPADVLKWDTARKAAIEGGRPPAEGNKGPARREIHNAYVVLKRFSVPTGLYGDAAATFFVPKGVPLPTGNLGHSVLLDFNSMSCRGSGLCGVLERAISSMPEPRQSIVKEAR